MSTEEKARAYDEALERAKKIHDEILNNEILGFPDQIREIFPELRGLEDERIRKWLIDYFSSIKKTVWLYRDITCEQILEWLEKQKEQNKCPEFCSGHCVGCEQKEQKPLETPSPSVIYTEQGDVLAEQKPASTEDMPYITDEHFYEREPADSFKYKLAEYMTRCCTKKEGPYGYEYGISAESILKMAKEELLKRGVVQKPAAWSEEDEKIMQTMIKEGDLKPSEIAWLKSLRPSWKPSEEQMEALERASTNEYLSAKQFDILVSLYEQLKKL